MTSLDRLGNLFPVFLIAIASMLACENIQHGGDCGSFQQIGTLECTDSQGHACQATYPAAIVYPASYNTCLFNVSQGSMNCNSCGAMVTTYQHNYRCIPNECDVEEIGVNDVQECCTATLTGGACGP